MGHISDWKNKYGDRTEEIKYYNERLKNATSDWEKREIVREMKERGLDIAMVAEGIGAGLSDAWDLGKKAFNYIKNNW